MAVAEKRLSVMEKRCLRSVWSTLMDRVRSEVRRSHVIHGNPLKASPT